MNCRELDFGFMTLLLIPGTTRDRDGDESDGQDETILPTVNFAIACPSVALYFALALSVF